MVKQKSFLKPSTIQKLKIERIITKRQTDEFHKKCGEIITSAVKIESLIESLISAYFCLEPLEERLKLKDKVIIKLNFERKINLLQEMCKDRDLCTPQKIKKIIDSIRFIQRVRNDVAHNHRFIGDIEEGVVLLKKETFKSKKDELKLDNEFMKNFNKKMDTTSRGLFDIRSDFGKKTKAGRAFRISTL